MLVYGRNSVYEFLVQNKVKKLYLQTNFRDDKFEGLIDDSITKYVDRFVLDKMVEGNHQGMIAEIEDFEYTDLSDIIGNKENCTIVILDHLEDPHNLGAIIRTCEAAGMDGIVIPNKRSVEVNPTVIKTSVGAIQNIPISMVSNIVQTMESLKKDGFWIVGTDMNGTTYTDIDYSGRMAIVIGNEGKGMSQLVQENCDFIASIPMYGKVNSLNASVAAGIMIYEVIRQTRK